MCTGTRRPLGRSCLSGILPAHPRQQTRPDSQPIRLLLPSGCFLDRHSEKAFVDQGLFMTFVTRVNPHARDPLPKTFRPLCDRPRSTGKDSPFPHEFPHAHTLRQATSSAPTAFFPPCAARPPASAAIVQSLSGYPQLRDGIGSSSESPWQPATPQPYYLPR